MPVVKPGSRGPVGYPDYQRVENWDGVRLLYFGTLAKHTGLQTYGPYFVGQYAALLVSLSKGNKPITVRFTWSYEGEVEVGNPSREISLEPVNGPARAQLRLPNLGPWVTIEFIPESEATKWEMVAAVLPTNRQYAYESNPVSGLVIPETLKKVKGASEGFWYPEWLWGGPVQAYVNTNKKTGAFGVEYYNVAAAAWKYSVLESLEGKEWYNIKAVVPLTAWRVKVYNNPAEEASITVTVAPAVTGST